MSSYFDVKFIQIFPVESCITYRCCEILSHCLATFECHLRDLTSFFKRTCQQRLLNHVLSQFFRPAKSFRQIFLDTCLILWIAKFSVCQRNVLLLYFLLSLVNAAGVFHANGTFIVLRKQHACECNWSRSGLNQALDTKIDTCLGCVQ